MPDFLFDSSLRINKIISKSNSIFLFLDYDGTLVPFKDRPTDVTTSKSIKKIIRQLIRNPKVTVTIVTGRTLRDIKRLLKIQGLSYIALHGLHIESSSGFQFSWHKANQARLLIKKIKEDVQLKLRKENGAFLEDKELTLVLHYRLVSTDKIKSIQETFKRSVNRIDKKKILEIINGAKVIEARPKGWNKGKAVEQFLLKNSNKKNILTIYIGDDITDEDAFQFIAKKGISIYVTNKSNRKTAAQYWVKNPDQVFLFLRSLHQLIH